jgi:nicotinate-nucleotide adenylyltransferase
MLSYEQRYRMLQAFTADIQADINCTLEVSDIEQNMHSEGVSPIYTFDVLERLQQQNPNQSLTFIMGPDNAAPEIWKKFYKSEEIDTRWSKLICEEHAMIRSTYLREAVNNEAKDSELLTLTTPSVLSIIRSENLYRTLNH